MYNEGLVFDDIKYISEEIHQQMISTEVLPNDVLLNITGASLGRCAVVPSNFKKGSVSQHVCILRPIVVLADYLHCFILSSFFSKEMKVTGSGREGLPKYNLEKMLLPIPPLFEQERIVAEIKRWFSLINEIETDKQDLLEFVDHAKSKVFDLAIHGKLVSQDPSDEPAIELLKRMNPDFVPWDTSHYPNLPESWCVCTLGDIVKVINGKNQSKVVNPNGAYPIYGSGGIMGYADDYLCPENCTIIGRKGTINNPILVETKFWNVDTAFGMVPSEAINYRYFYYFCSSFDFTKLDKSTTLPSLTKSNIEKIEIPLPPLAEQDKIVIMIEKLFSLLDAITMKL